MISRTNANVHSRQAYQLINKLPLPAKEPFGYHHSEHQPHIATQQHPQVLLAAIRVLKPQKDVEVYAFVESLYDHSKLLANSDK